MISPKAPRSSHRLSRLRILMASDATAASWALQKLVLSLSASALMLAVAWWIVHTIRHPHLSFFQTQYAIVEPKAEMIAPGGVLVIGDSIPARINMPELCGRSAFDAGIAWATSHDWVPHAARLIQITRPSVVIVELGNDDSRSDWREDYRQIAKLATFAVTPKQPDRAAFIRPLLPTVPVPAQTVDGTHLTTDGANEWIRRVDEECRQLHL